MIVPVRCESVEAVKYTYVGAYFNVFFPGDMGGDIVKTYCVATDSDKKISRIAPTVIIDRIIGLLTMLLIPGAVLLFNDLSIKVMIFGEQVEIDFLIYLGTVLVIIFIFLAMKIGSLIRIIKAMDIKSRIGKKVLFKADEILDGFVDKNNRYVSAVMWSVLSQLFLYIGCFYPAVN